MVWPTAVSRGGILLAHCSISYNEVQVAVLALLLATVVSLTCQQC